MKTLLIFSIPPQILWLAFIVVAVLVVLCSKQLSKYVAGISEKTSLGGAFLGAFVLSMVTSIPELISSITSSLLGNPTLSYGNVIGVNMMTLTMLVTMDAIFVKKALFSKVSNANRNTILTVFFYNVALALFIFIKPLRELYIPLGITVISPLPVLMFGYYVFFIYRVYKSGKAEDDEGAEDSGCGELSLKTVVIRFVIYAILLILLSVAISNITDQMSLPVDEGGYGLGAAFAGALFLSICTGLPEMTSCIELSKMGQGNIAIGGIVGSHLFNFLIFFFGDLFYASNTTLKELALDSEQFAKIKVFLIAGMILNLILFANTFKKNVKNKFIYILPCAIIFVLYFLVMIFQGNLIALFN